MLLKQMVTESEAYIIILVSTLKFCDSKTYEKTTKELYNILSTFINNNIIERYID